MRAGRALHLGRAEDQPGYSVLDLESRKMIVTPHVRFVEDSFPGLTSSPRSGEPTADAMQRLFGEPSHAPVGVDLQSDFDFDIEGGGLKPTPTKGGMVSTSSPLHPPSSTTPPAPAILPPTRNLLRSTKAAARGP